MNYYQPRQTTDGHWHYTCRNDDRIRPVGYCAERRCKHETPEEAIECYGEYQLSGMRLEHATMAHQQLRCDVEDCDEWTQTITQVGRGMGSTRFHLCDEHRTEEVVRELYSPPECLITS